MASAPATRAQNSATRCSNSVQNVLVAAEKPVGAWPEHLAQHQEAADAVAGLDGGDLLAHERVVAVGAAAGTSS